MSLRVSGRRVNTTQIVHQRYLLDLFKEEREREGEANVSLSHFPHFSNASIDTDRYYIRLLNRRVAIVAECALTAAASRAQCAPYLLAINYSWSVICHP